MTESQRHGGADLVSGWNMYVVSALVMIFVLRRAIRHTKQILEPRRRRLQELLASLEAHD